MNILQICTYGGVYIQYTLELRNCTRTANPNVPYKNCYNGRTNVLLALRHWCFDVHWPTCYFKPNWTLNIVNAANRSKSMVFISSSCKDDECVGYQSKMFDHKVHISLYTQYKHTIFNNMSTIQTGTIRSNFIMTWFLWVRRCIVWHHVNLLVCVPVCAPAVCLYVLCIVYASICIYLYLFPSTFDNNKKKTTKRRKHKILFKWAVCVRARVCLKVNIW